MDLKQTQFSTLDLRAAQKELKDINTTVRTKAEHITKYYQLQKQLDEMSVTTQCIMIQSGYNGSMMDYKEMVTTGYYNTTKRRLDNWLKIVLERAYNELGKCIVIEEERRTEQ